MRRDTPDKLDTYWTPWRVRYWLERYMDLCRVVYRGCAVHEPNAEQGAWGRSKSRSHRDLATPLLCIKCDLDVALKRLRPSVRRCLLLYFSGGCSLTSLAQHGGATRQSLAEALDRAILQMAAALGYHVPRRRLRALRPRSLRVIEQVFDRTFL